MEVSGFFFASQNKPTKRRVLWGKNPKKSENPWFFTVSKMVQEAKNPENYK